MIELFEKPAEFGINEDYVRIVKPPAQVPQPEPKEGGVQVGFWHCVGYNDVCINAADALDLLKFLTSRKDEIEKMAVAQKQKKLTKMMELVKAVVS